MRIAAVLVILGVPALLAAQFKSEVRLVEVYASVFDHKGNPVDSLGKERFRILDNGVPQPILSFESAADSLSCTILIDTTGSMRDALGSVRNAVSGLLDRLREGDSVAIYGFSTQPVLLQDFTTDKAAAKRAISRTRAAGETALFDRLRRSARK